MIDERRPEDVEVARQCHRPAEVIEESGAESLRLWVASSDFRDEVRVGKQILQRVVEAYRKIRNTCRYLLANLYDFDPARDAARA